jgi:hypothetical protein
MAGRSPAIKERDYQIITEYYLKGYSTRAIARKIISEVAISDPESNYSITHKTVSKDINVLLKQWRDERIHDITQLKVSELTKIDRLEQTYWDAWEKSIENHKRTSEKLRGEIKAKDNKPSFRETTEMNIREFGEPRYLQGIERCIDKRCKLLGLDAPVKLEHQDHSFLSFLMTTE